MNFAELTNLVFLLMAMCLGAFLGVLGSRMVAMDDKTAWKWAFYVLSGFLAIVSVIYFFVFRTELSKPNINGVIALLSALISAFLMFSFTRRYLDVKNVYTTTELDPIINQFTSIADKNEIKLFGGDLNFLGNSTIEIDVHPQYIHLRSLRFNRVFILCEEPNDSSKMLRYGKILVEIPNVELRFYHPEKADLRVRGRLIKVNGVDKLLMYNKVGGGRYRTIETDTANSNGALYNNIWELVWAMAIKPSQDQINMYINLFKMGGYYESSHS